MSEMGGFLAGSIVAKLLLDDTGFHMGMVRAQKDMSGLGGIATAVGTPIVKVAELMGAAAVAAAGAITLIAKQTASAGDQIYELSQKTGISAQVLSSLKLAADKSGTSLDGLSIGLRFLSRSMVAADDDVKMSAGAFQELGIKVRGANGEIRPMTDVMMDVADRFAGMENGAQKSALAIKLFGRSGTELIPMLNMGSAGLREQMELAEKLGIVFTEKTAAAAHRYVDSLVELRDAFAGLRNIIGNAIIPVLTQFVEAGTGSLERLSAKLKELSDSGKLREWVVETATVFIQAFKLMSLAAEGLIIAINAIPGFFEKTKGAFETWVADMSEKAADQVKGTGRLADETRSHYINMSDAARMAAEESNTTADKYLEAASTTVEAFQNIGTELDKLKASLGKAGTVGKLSFTAIGAAAGMTEEQITTAVRKISEDFDNMMPVEIPIELDFSNLDAERIPKTLKEGLDEAGDAAQKEGRRITAALRAMGPDLVKDMKEKVAMLSLTLAEYGRTFPTGVTYNMRIELLKLSAAMKVSALDWGTFFTNLESGWSNTIATFLEGGMNIANALKAIWIDIRNAFFKMVADMIAKWATFEILTGIFSLIFPGAIFAQHGFQGIVSKATSFVAGEAGPELVSVTPVSKLQQIARGSFAAPRFTGAPAMAAARAAGGGAVFTLHTHAPIIQTTGISRREVDDAAEYFFQSMENQARRRGFRFGK